MTVNHSTRAAPRTAAAGTAAEPGQTNGPAAMAVLIYLGFSLQLLQVGIIPLLPLIGHDLHVSPGATSWLVTASLLSGAICLAVLTRLADIIGKRRVIVICLALVFAGSILGWIAQGFAMLIVARVLMGAVLPMLALPEAIAADTMPRQRAQVTIGAIHAGTGIGIAAGLLLGALAGAGEASWRSFFIVGALASALGIVATLAAVQESPARARGRLDLIGAGLLSAGLICLLLAFSQGPTWGWGSASVRGVGLLGILLLVAWWRSERIVAHPLISVQHLLRPDMRIPYAITFLVAFGIYAALTAITRLAQMPTKTGFGYGFSTLQVAWYALPQALGSLAGLLIIRRLVPRGRAIQALAIGSILVVLAFVFFGVFTRRPGLTMTGLLLDSTGLAVTLAVSQIVIVRAVGPVESGIALGLSIVLYAVGNTVGSAVVGVLFKSLTIGHTVLPSLAAFRWGFALSGLAAVLAAALCLPLARQRRARALPGEHIEGPLGA
jgi:predicted MFS family arabinose efflux permease